MKDSTRRALRTAIDSTLAGLATIAALAAYLAGTNTSTLLGISPEIVFKTGAVAVAVTFAISKFKNELEEHNILLPFLKAPEKEGEPPVSLEYIPKDGIEFDSKGPEDENESSDSRVFEESESTTPNLLTVIDPAVIEVSK